MGSVISNLPERLICCFQPPDLRNSLEFLQCVWQRSTFKKQMDGYCNSIWCCPGYLSKTISILYRNFQYKYAENYKAVLFHEGKGVNKGCSQLMVIWLHQPCLGSLCSLHPPLLPCVWEVLTLSLARQLPSVSISHRVSLKNKKHEIKM